MRKLMLGLISFTGAALVACEDAAKSDAEGGSGGTNASAGSPGNGGSAGSAGAGGVAGAAGQAGGASTGGAGGGAGSSNAPGGDAGTDADGTPCSGCVELVVPVDGTVQNTIFNFVLPSAVDMSDVVITYRVRALTLGSELHANPVAQDADYGGFATVEKPFTAANGFVDDDTWTNLTFDLSEMPAVNSGQPIPAQFDKSAVKQFGLHVGTGGTFSGATSVRVLVDSVTFTGVDDSVLPDITFTDDADGLVINDYGPRPNSEVIHHP